jgi:hypothetical protein
VKRAKTKKFKEEIQMNKINLLAKTLQENGFDSPAGQNAWGEIYCQLIDTIEAEVSIFIKKHGYSNKIDPSDLISLASYEGLQLAVKDWDINKGEFVPFFTRKLQNRVFVDYWKLNLGTATANKFYTDTVSIYTQVDEETVIADFIESDTDIEAEVIEDETELALREYERMAGKVKSTVVRILMETVFDKQEQTSLICQVYGVDKYDNTIASRVKRVKKHFQEFYMNFKLNRKSC